MIKNYINIFAIGALLLSGCIKPEPTDTGIEYAPDMYLSVPYDPYSQVNINPNNPNGMNMRTPPKGTLPRVKGLENNISIELMPIYPIGRDSIAYAEAILKNPVQTSTEVLEKGKYLYDSYCLHCHGAEGKGNGPVAEKYGGVANFNADYVKTKKSGHIYHVITMGKGRMWPHGSQILPADRWKIVHYVNKLRNYNEVNGQ